MVGFDSARRFIKTLPGVKPLAQSRWGQALRYWFALHFENRQSFTFTQFLRLPTQYDALTGPVITYVGGADPVEPLRIVVFGCSTGAEAYSISSMLLLRHPQLAVTIDAYDIDPVVIETAKEGAYDPKWVLENALVTPEFIAATFDQQHDRFKIRPAVAKRVAFHTCDVLNAGAMSRIPTACIVYAQNIMCNMPRSMAARAFQNICGSLADVSALLIDGMDLDMRSRLTRAHCLDPLDFELRRIHEEARIIRGPRYPWYATGLEPWSPDRRDRIRRYATVFFRGVQ